MLSHLQNMQADFGAQKAGMIDILQRQASPKRLQLRRSSAACDSPPLSDCIAAAALAYGKVIRLGQRYAHQVRRASFRKPRNRSAARDNYRTRRWPKWYCAASFVFSQMKPARRSLQLALLPASTPPLQRVHPHSLRAPPEPAHPDAGPIMWVEASPKATGGDPCPVRAREDRAAF